MRHQRRLEYLCLNVNSCMPSDGPRAAVPHVRGVSILTPQVY